MYMHSTTLTLRVVLPDLVSLQCREDHSVTSSATGANSGSAGRANKRTLNLFLLLKEIYPDTFLY